MKLHANVCSQWEWTKLRQLLVIVLLGLGIVSTYGQTKTVSGIVKSESGGEPLVGATVKVKETNTGGITDIDGRYTIQANLGQTLIVSYIGYRTKEVKVERTTRIDILLQEDNEMLDEVVVVGYGTMKRSDLTGSVVSVTGDELKKSVVTSLDQALQGRAAGVQVTQNSGTPGGGISVSIRGINSLNGNEPLYVIDGVAISGNNTSNSSVLSSINPADIVSMEVLKDASATAIYGSRASNGVTHHHPSGRRGQNEGLLRRLLCLATASQETGNTDTPRICSLPEPPRRHHRLRCTRRVQRPLTPQPRYRLAE